MRTSSKGPGGPTIPEPKIRGGPWLDEEPEFKYELPNIHFGSGSGDDDDLPETDDDDDDELLDETDPEVVEMLGFDPLELEDEE